MTEFEIAQIALDLFKTKNAFLNRTAGTTTYESCVEEVKKAHGLNVLHISDAKELSEDFLNTSIDNLDFITNSPYDENKTKKAVIRMMNCLKCLDIKTVRDLCNTKGDIKGIPNFGRISHKILIGMIDFYKLNQFIKNKNNLITL